MGKTRSKTSRSCPKEESQLKRLQRKLDEAKHEIKQLRNIIKRTNPERLHDVLESDKLEYQESTKSTKQKEPKDRGPRCPKCQGFKLSPVTFTRADGTFSFTICKASHCGFRTSLAKADETESIKPYENDSKVMEEDNE